MKEKQPLANRGFLEFIDKRGLTYKAKKCKLRYSLISKKLDTVFDGMGLKVFANAATVVSSSQFNRLEEILDITIKNNKAISFPFTEELLIRTCIFGENLNLSLPSKQIKIKSPKETAEEIKRLLPALVYTDQIILHPRLSSANLKKKMIACRFKTIPGGIEAEIGTGGIEHVFQIQDAELIIKAEVKKEIEINVQKNKCKLEDFSTMNKLLLGAKFFLPFADKVLAKKVPDNSGVVYEFRAVLIDNMLDMELNDFEMTSKL